MIFSRYKLQETQIFSNKTYGIVRSSDNKIQCGEETISYGEAQVNLIRATIFTKRKVDESFEKIVKCNYCQTMFSTKASLTRHLKKLNCKEESQQLNSLSYLSLSQIKEAIYGSKNVKKREDQNAVPVIHKNLTPLVINKQKSYQLKKDEQTTTSSEGFFNCQQCSKVFKNKQTLQAHSMAHKKQEYLCPICGKQFFYKSSLASHQSVHQLLPKTHVCSKCEARFTTQRSLRRHYFTHYNYKDKEFICESCGKRFAYSMALKNHKLSHSEERPYACRICGTSFKRSTHLRTHEQGVHGLQDSSSPKKFTCAICQKSMVKKESLEAHMKEHIGELNYQCDDCQKKFATNTGLNIHITMGRCQKGSRVCNICVKEFEVGKDVCEHLRTKPQRLNIVKEKVKSGGQKSKIKKLSVPRHMKEKNYFCKICGRCYIYPCELKTHFRLAHTDEKPFVCGLCGKAFKTKACLQIHEDVHNDIRPYKCDVCEKRFRKTEHVKLHMRTHTGEKPHVCNECGRGFAQKGDMKKHILKIHKVS